MNPQPQSRGLGNSIGVAPPPTPSVQEDALTNNRYALSFDGDDFVQVPNWRQDGSRPLTVEAWVNPAGPQSRHGEANLRVEGQRVIVSNTVGGGGFDLGLFPTR